MKFKKNYEKPSSKRNYTSTEPSKTQQQFRDDNNPYTVIDKHTRGLPVSGMRGTPQYLDVSEINPETHSTKIDQFKKSIDEKRSKIENDQKELNEKRKKQQFEETHDYIKTQNVVPKSDKN